MAFFVLGNEVPMMFGLPPVPSWDGLHPLIIHFPIGLLFVAPIFVVVGALLKPEKSKPMFSVALALMVLGTASSIIAMKSGEAAARLAERNPQVNSVLERHEELAEQTVTTFSVLTVVFLAISALPWVIKKVPPRVLTTALPLLFLVGYAWGVVALSNTAHNGGRLVHEFGVHARVAPSSTPTQPAGQGTAEPEAD
jgi:uncharacterized membrane protein